MAADHIPHAGSNTAASRRPTRADLIRRNLQEMIVEGAFADGDRLPSEAELASRFGVSRPVLRQALQSLKKDGLVLSRQGAGNFIIRPSHKPAEAPAIPRVSSISEIGALFEYRSGIEGETAALAALRRTPQDLERMKQGLQDLERAVDSASLGVAADFAFHELIARASGNSFYLATLQALKANLTFTMNLARHLSLQTSRETVMRVHREHISIVEGISAGDPERARALMRGHIEAVRQRLFEGKVIEDEPVI